MRETLTPRSSSYSEPVLMETLPPTPHPPPPQPTVAQHSVSQRTPAVALAHLVQPFVVKSLFALALTVAVRGARCLHHLVLATHPAAEALPDVVPQLREGTLGTRRAHALLGRRAAREQVRTRGAAVALQLGARLRVSVFERAGLRGGSVDTIGCECQQQQKRLEDGKQHLEEGNRRRRC